MMGLKKCPMKLEGQRTGNILECFSCYFIFLVLEMHQEKKKTTQCILQKNQRHLTLGLYLPSSLHVIERH